MSPRRCRVVATLALVFGDPYSMKAFRGEEVAEYGGRVACACKKPLSQHTTRFSVPVLFFLSRTASAPEQAVVAPRPLSGGRALVAAANAMAFRCSMPSMNWHNKDYSEIALNQIYQEHCEKEAKGFMPKAKYTCNPCASLAMNNRLGSRQG